MCGIAGFLAPDAVATMQQIVETMADSLAHRGPDDAGVWLDAEPGIALAHRRLAILDLSPAGHQPMLSRCGRFVLVFNGEIYNHPELRRELEPPWRGHSDTETLLAAFAAWGVAATLKRCVGMFALALWDRQRRELILARDRMGEKPLYYGWQNGVFLFASELKALRRHPAFKGEIDRSALAMYLRHNYVPAPHSIFQGVAKLPPGCMLTVSTLAPATLEPIPYWSVRAAACSGLHAPFPGNESDAADELERLLRQSVRGQMLADVPVGAFLSGGIDSSTVVALMQQEASRPVHTFTIGFHESGYDEAVHAQAVAAHLGTRHCNHYVTPEEALAVIPLLPAIYDEPFADSTQIPNLLLSQIARHDVSAALSGDGGDELFAGYGRYFVARRLWSRMEPLPPALRRSLAWAATRAPAWLWSGLERLLSSTLPMKLRDGRSAERVEQLARLLRSRDAEALYLELLSHWHDPETVVVAASGAQRLDPPVEWTAYENHMMLHDQTHYLPDDILVKVDRAAMGVSLETRVPLLDHRLVEFAWSLPLDMKIRAGEGKWLLRQVLYRHIPRHLIERPKMGFGVPIDAWLRGPLKDWAEALLDETRLRREGYFAPAPIRQKWAEHLSGRRNWAYHLWDVLMFQAWLEAQRG